MDVLERVHGQRPVSQLLLGTLKLFAGVRRLVLNRTTYARYWVPLATEQHKNQHESVRQLVDKRHTDAQEAGQGKPKRQRILDGFDAINDESRLLVRRLFPVHPACDRVARPLRGFLCLTLGHGAVVVW